MKAKVTKKHVLSYYDNVLELGYCDLQTLLNRFSPQYYTCGVYGWNADIYIIDGMCICTGYRPFGNIHISRELREQAGQAYNELKEKHLSYEEESQAVKSILKRLFNK